MEDRGKEEQNRAVKIVEVIGAVKKRGIPIIHQRSSLDVAIDTIVRFPHSRLLYVVDDDGRLLGTISLGNLVRHFFSRSHEPQIHPRFLISMITTETARDIMETHPIFTTEEEAVEAVLRRMIEKNVKEIAVLDSQKRPVADLTMIDLLRFLIQTGKTIP